MKRLPVLVLIVVLIVVIVLPAAVAQESTPGDIVLRLRAQAPPGAASVRAVLSSYGVVAQEITPVFSAAHAARLRGASDDEITRAAIAHLREKSARQNIPERAPGRGLGDVYRVRLSDTGAGAERVAAALRGHPLVAWAEPNEIARMFYVPNDPYYSSTGTWGQAYDDLWGIKRIGCQAAWNVNMGAPGVVVAVVDTGIQYAHEDLAANIWINTGEVQGNGIDDDGNGYIDDIGGYDFCTFNGKLRDADPTDDNGHGTHCAGTIAGVMNNAVGVVGVAGHSRVMALKGLDVSGTGYITDLAEAIVYAADNGASVISNSWGSFGWKAPQVLQDAVAYAHDLGCVIVAAAGNSNADALMFNPGNLKDSITVSAQDPNDARASFSNWGAKIDVAAPGVDILSCLAAGSALEQQEPDMIVGGKYLRLEGTSMAAPHVAGVAALVLSERPSFTNEQVRQVLRATATDLGALGWDADFGWGRVNASGAVGLPSALTVTLASPWHRDYIKGVVSVVGTAAGSIFSSYRVEFGAGLAPAPEGWTLIREAYSEVVGGELASWDTSALADGDYTVRVVARDRAGTRFEDRAFVWKDTTLHNGWPVEMAGPVYASTAVRDIGGQSGAEVVVGTPATTGDGHVSGRYEVFAQDGSRSPGAWPRDIPGPIADSVAVGDIDLDGSPEIIATSLGYRKLYAWRGDGSSLTGFPVDISNGVSVHQGGGFMSDKTPALANLDADLAPEIVVPSNGKVWAINADGTSVAGWPVTLPVDPGFLLDSPAVAIADIDGCGALEVITWVGWEEDSYPYARHHRVHVLEHDGLATPGWPVSSDTVSALSAPTVGDIDGDGDLEVMLDGRPLPQQLTGYVNAWHHDGTVVSGWPVAVGYEGLTDAVLADLDGSGGVEVLVATTAHRLYAFRGDGSMMLELPATVGGAPHPVVGDIDGDGQPDILAGGFYGELKAWRVNGTLLSGWPKRTRDLISTSATLADMDGDAYLEVVAGSKDERLYAWDLTAPFNQNTLQWPTYRGNPARTGRYIVPPEICHFPPPEVTGVSFVLTGAAHLAWTGQGLGRFYEVTSGLASALRADGGVDAAVCVANELPDPFWRDLRPAPPAGDGNYYLVRATNPCGPGTWGSASNGEPRLPTSDCP